MPLTTSATYWASLFTLLAAFLYGLAQVLARKLGDSEAAPVITSYQNAAFLVGRETIGAVLRQCRCSATSEES